MLTAWKVAGRCVENVGEMGGPTLIPLRVGKVEKGRSVIGGACFATELVVGGSCLIILEVIGQLLHNRWSWGVIREGGYVLASTGHR